MSLNLSVRGIEPKAEASFGNDKIDSEEDMRKASVSLTCFITLSIRLNTN